MTPIKWLLLAIGAVVVVAYATWWYRTREEPVPGRAWAAALRSVALLLAWLILLDPTWPGALRRPDGRELALLDASYSMSRPVRPGGPTAWSVALDSAANYDGVWLFGGPIPRYSAIDSLPTEPLYSKSRLTPALRAAALSDARTVTVITDGGLSDVAEAIEEARLLGLDVSIVTLRPAYGSVGIAELDASRWVEAGDTGEVRVELVADAADRDSVRIEVVDDADRVRARGWVRLPEAGRFSSLRLSFPVTATRAGYRRYAVRVALDARDPEPRDDERAFYVRVTDRPAGPVLISLRPDWEPSFLIPNLDRLTDAPTTAYYLLSDSLVRLEGYRRVGLAAAQRQARAAPLLVLHGYGADAPPWARDLVRNARRLIVWPAGTRPFELPGWDVRVSVPAQGEWYAADDLPASPLALELAGLPLRDLAPLLRVRAIDGNRAWSPLNLQRLRRGEPRPAVVAGVAGSRRWVVAAAEGYWRWSFRRGAGRELYRALWTGLGGWLLEGRRSGDVGLEPREHVVVRGGALSWTVPLDADSLSVEVQPADSGAVWRGTALSGDSLTVSLPPGRYRYSARAYIAGSVAARADGPAEIEEFSRELLPASSSSLRALADAAAVRRADDAGGGRRRLATLGWPYLILIALLCAEWAVRRYIGLR